MGLVPEKRTGLEFLDLPPDVCTLEELAGSLAELRVVNRYLGNRRVLLKHLSACLRPGSAASVLDVATGSADLPVEIVEWGRRRGIEIRVTGVDLNSRSIEVARRHTSGYPEITLSVADALSLPFADGSFDFVICSKTLHHMKEGEAVRALQEILRVARRGYIVTDLRRTWMAYLLIWILVRLFSRNRITRYDGPLSVLKSFTKEELAALASAAGAEGFRVTREPFWLLALSGDVP